MKRISKRITALVLSFALVLPLLSGCAGPFKKKENVTLTIWGNENMTPYLEEKVEEFKELHKNEANFNIIVSSEGEDTCKDAILADPDNAADIFSFPDDQFDELYKTGHLMDVTDDKDYVIDSVGGEDQIVSKIVIRDGKMYAYPQTSGNGYFLYYNKNYLSEDDVKTMDGILKACAKSGKKFSMDFKNGWYIYSFFKGAGLSLEYDEESGANICDFNKKSGKYQGVDVAESMLDIAGNDAFISLSDDAFVKAVQDEEVIAGVNGPWNSKKIQDAWGDDYGVVKLPTYTVKDDQVQMASFAGFKLMGINSKTEYPKWAMELAKFLSGKEGQIERYEVTGECPVNKEALEAEEIQSDPTVLALSAQQPYAQIQRVASPYWDASAKFGVTIAGGNSGKRDLQELLDELVKDTTAIQKAD